MNKRLSTIKNGELVRVSSVEPSALKVKLSEMGIITGRMLEVLYRAPFGDPIAVDVDGYVLSLRLDEADLIHVETKAKQGK